MTTEKKPRARPLKTIAAWINEHTELLGLKASVSRSSTWKERHRSAGMRYSFGGRTVYGNWLVVTTTRPVFMSKLKERQYKKGEIVLDHDASQTYRSNDEVERWLARFVENLPAAARKKLGPEAVARKNLYYGW